MPSPPSAVVNPLELQSLWLRATTANSDTGPALLHPWGARHRPDWAARGLIIWPRGGQWCQLRLSLACPQEWRALGPGVARARLALRWWAEAAEVRVRGALVREGDLFDSGCRWALPEDWWREDAWPVELRLRSPRHDDGALVLSRLELEPLDPDDPHGILAPTVDTLRGLREASGLADAASPAARWQVLGHAHLDLAWLWPVADTWRAAERTFESVLALMTCQEQLHFGHSTPALYAWLEQHRPTLHGRIRETMRQGRWEPLNGPWVECDCVLIDTPSLLRQFQEGQWYSRRAFPEWRHALAWLPDSFGFSAGLPAVAAATGVRWFCTHKLAWNSDNPFPHRLFRWRGRCGREVLALMTPPIGTDGDPVAMENHRLAWERSSGVAEALWLPGVGDHGGGPTLEMLEQLALWQGREGLPPQTHGTLRSHLDRLEPLAPRLPVWRDELYLELHRGCATSRPDQKRHNRTLERLLREAETALALLAARETSGAAVEGEEGRAESSAPDWRPLLFQQFHDILPGTAIPDVFTQAEPIWRRARRANRRLRDQSLAALWGKDTGKDNGTGKGKGTGGSEGAGKGAGWTAGQLHCLPPTPRTARLPRGAWLHQGVALPAQEAPGGGMWVQLPGLDGVAALPLQRRQPASQNDPSAPSAPSAHTAAPVWHPVTLQPLPDKEGSARWRLANGLVAVTLGPRGVEGLEDGAGQPLLGGPLRWCRYGDRGEFWDAWDLSPAYRDHPLPWTWEEAPRWEETGPLCARLVWRGRCGQSAVRLDGRLLAGSPWFELVLRLDWRQRHELLRLVVPLASPACRWAADAPGAVIERPTEPRTARERSRWEVSAIRWIASAGEGRGDGVAVLLDGPQGVSAGPEELSVSLVRGPTWPDPGADNGLQRLRLALMPASGGWRAAAVPQQASRFREPLWIRPGGHPDAMATVATLPSQEPDVRVVALQAARGTRGESLLTVHNLGPCRRRLRLGERGLVVARVDGLHDALSDSVEGAQGGQSEGVEPVLPPWSLTFWRVRLQVARV